MSGTIGTLVQNRQGAALSVFKSGTIQFKSGTIQKPTLDKRSLIYSYCYAVLSI
jgi:hypothetical protein